MFRDRAHTNPVLRYVQLCSFGQLRQQVQVHHSGPPTCLNLVNHSIVLFPTRCSRRDYATQRLDVKRLRSDVDKRARLGFFALTNKQNILHIKANKAHGIIEDFLEQKNKLNKVEMIQHLSKKHRVCIEDLASLAIVTFKIPDLSDPEKRAMLPPSQHKHISNLLLRGCAEAEDPLAIIQIMSAVYLSSANSDESFGEIAGRLSPIDIARYRKSLEMLGERAKQLALGPDALTLQGLFLEREGRKQKAREVCEKAISLSHMKFNPKARHPMLLKVVEPWNALGYFCKTDSAPEAQVQAKRYFQMGAFEGDDPLSYFELACLEQKSSVKWLQYTSKAAASGHPAAVVNLAAFYQEASLRDSSILRNSDMRKILNWLLSWRPGSTAMLAKEWLQAATNTGHKPSMLKLADYYEANGEQDLAMQQLQQIIKPSSSTSKYEEWPQIVQLAKSRLLSLKM